MSFKNCSCTVKSSLAHNVLQVSVLTQNMNAKIFVFVAYQKYKRFCVMVDKSRRVDVDGSLKEREWNTEEFYAVLNQHTEEVRKFV